VKYFFGTLFVRPNFARNWSKMTNFQACFPLPKPPKYLRNAVKLLGVLNPPSPLGLAPLSRQIIVSFVFELISRIFIIDEQNNKNKLKLQA